MTKIVGVISFILILSVVILGLSCNLAANKSVPATSTLDHVGLQPVVNITYSGNFIGEEASGYLSLQVDMTIENLGFESFNTSPDSFSVIVDNYSYPSSESDLQTVDLPNGDKISGKLTFQVPPVAATTRVDYRMEHSGQTLYNIRWSKQNYSSGSVAVPIPEVSITYSDSFMWLKDTSILYLLLDLTIENRGYESFNTSPEYFTLILGNILGETTGRPPILFDGSISDQKDGAYSDLRSYDLQNGGKLIGTLAFQVPPEIFAATERYSLEYSGVRSYNIHWSWKPPLPVK